MAELLLGQYADIDLDAHGTCDALSLVLRITGVPAPIDEDGPRPE